MCGIAGILNLNDRLPVEDDAARRMISSMRHRGPDGFGLYRDKRVALAHARLSIIDLSGGQQPMSNEDGSVWITFNGEIFNYLELRQELIKKGHRFKTSSDTEVIVHLYEDHGPDCLDSLNGQFAFAVWDRGKNELFLARDRMGIRPLFYSVTGGRFLFSSEVKGIFASGAVDREIDPLALDEIFTFWCTVPPRTAFRNVCELAPGHFMAVSDAAGPQTRYWDIPFQDEPSKTSFEDASDELKGLLIDSTKLQLRADVPVGAYLSGGLDSSVTTALIRNFTGSPLQTFSVAFEDADYDESVYQKEVARALGCEHHEIKCSYDDISRSFPDVVWHAEKPVLRTAPAPLLMLSGLVRSNGFRVVLTGEGADEILGGYDIFKETKIRQFWARFPESQKRPLLLKRLYPYLPAFQGQSRAYREAFFNSGLSDTANPFFSHLPRWRLTGKNKLFFSSSMRASINSSTAQESLGASLPHGFHLWQPMARAQYLEAKGLLPGYILSSQGDRVLMANSVEGRFPFLDHRVVELCARLPLQFKLMGLKEKYILKKAMGKYLPQAIVKRTKQPYLAPDSKSFFGKNRPVDYAAELLSEECIREFGYFDPKPVRMLADKCANGGALGFKDNMAIVGILSTQILHHKFIKHFEAGSPAADIRVAG